MSTKHYHKNMKKCMSGINRVRANLRDCRKTNRRQNKITSVAQLNEGYKFKMNLTTNGVVITDAIKFVQTNKEKLTMSTKER